MNYRINYLDNAKAFGMILVFQGHLIEQYMWNGVDSFNFQMSLIYSFHMPFFFFLSGFFFKENSNHNLLIRLKTLFFKRITPVVFFFIVFLKFFFFC